MALFWHAEINTMMEKAPEQWTIRRKYADFEKIEKECGVDRLMALIMTNRGRSEEEAYSYFHGTLKDLRDPLLMKDLKKACGMILDYNGGIAIASDYDADGLFSGFSLHRAFDRLGIPNKIYVPDRVEEGYGLNERIVRQAKEEGFDFIITCDNGIAAIQAVGLAKELDMTVIVTDHHEIHYEKKEEGGDVAVLPAADAIVNPKQPDCGYPFKDLCGTGVVYFLIGELFKERGIPEDEMAEYLEYAAIATITDVMPLKEENRIIVKYGLRHLPETNNTGLRALMEVCGLQKGGSVINSFHVGYILGPCFNATGRIREIIQSVELLSQKNYEKAVNMAMEIKNVNEERKKMTEEGRRLAFGLLKGESAPDEDNVYMGESVICLYLKGVHESIVGLVAGKIREEYNKPVFVFTDSSEGIKGSGRSTENYNMFEGISKCSSLLEKFGGHPMAAGLSLKKENYEEFKRRINDESGLTKEKLVHNISLDAQLPFSYIKKDIIRQFSCLEPFGKENEAPLFCEKVKIKNLKIIGKNNNMLKFSAVNNENISMEAVYFGDAAAFFEEAQRAYGSMEKENLLKGRENSAIMNIIFSPDINEYKGKESIQIKIKKYHFINA